MAKGGDRTTNVGRTPDVAEETVGTTVPRPWNGGLEKNTGLLWVCKGHTLGSGVLLGNGDTPVTPNKFWVTTLKDFATLEFRRKDGVYEDADEGAEEPIWESYRHDRPITDDQYLWEGSMGIRQIKDLFKRGTRQLNRIMATVGRALTLIQAETVAPTWAADE